MKNRTEIPEIEAPRGKRRRREEHDIQPLKDNAPRKWKERDGYFQGAKVSRR